MFVFFRYVYFVFLFSLLSFSSSIFADYDDVSQYGAGLKELLPQAVVNQSVDVVSGTYFDSQTDLQVQGPENFTFERHFHFSRREYIAPFVFETFGVGNRVNHPYEIGCMKRKGVLDNSGSLCFFKDTKTKQEVYGFDHHLFLVDKYFDKGFTNLSSPDLGASRHWKNYKLYVRHYNGHQEDLRVCLPDGGHRKYYTPKTKPFGQSYFLEYETLASKNAYTYSYDKDWRLSHIFLRNFVEAPPLASFKFIYDDKNEYVSEIKASNGTWVRYEYDQSKKEDIGHHVDYKYTRTYNKWPCITKATYSHQPSIFYTFDEKGTQLIKKVEAGSYLETNFITYQKDEQAQEPKRLILFENFLDPRYKRVKDQYAPVGKNGKRTRVGRFEYLGKKANHRFESFRKTAFYDAHDNLTLYEYNKQGRITKIDTHFKVNDEQVLKNTQEFFWGEKDAHEEGDFLGKLTKDSKGKILHGVYLEYDKHHNVSAKYEYGNLSGTFTGNIEVDKQGKPLYLNSPQKLEVRKILFKSNEKGQLLEQIEGDLRVVLEYKNFCNKPSKILTYHKEKILKRQFFSYNTWGQLSQNISDDGNNPSKSNLSGITKRSKFDYIYSYKPLATLPLEETESYLNPQTQQYDVKLITKRTFNRQGQVTKQIFYDFQSKQKKVEEFEYEKGLLIKKTEADGSVAQFAYDKAHNLIREQKDKAIVSYEYDKANRVSCKLDQSLNHNQKPLKVKKESYLYDEFGRIIKQIDPNGANWDYQYQAFGGVSELKYPAITYQGKVTRPIEKRKYDDFGRLTEQVSPGNQKSTYRYNSLGKKTQIIHPDGLKELWTYDKKGRERFHQSKTGICSYFQYDAFDRLESVTIVSQDKKSKRITQNFYQGDHLVKTIDSTGKTITYEYDHMGRKIAQKNGTQKISLFSYDGFDRLIKQIDTETSKEGAYASKCYKYNAADQVIEETLFDKNNLLQEKKSWQYDALGNVVIANEAITLQEKSTTKFFYNGRKELEKQIDPDGHASYFVLKLGVSLSENEKGFLKTAKDPLGAYVEEIYDALNRLKSKKVFSSQQIALQESYFDYDLKGNLTLQKDLQKNTNAKNFVIKFEYDEKGRLCKVIEGQQNPRTSLLEYNDYNQLIRKTYPTGKKVSFSYDGFSNLITKKARGIHYEYTYNNQDQIIKVSNESGATPLITKRSYDQYGRLKSESFQNGLELKIDLDGFNRLKKIQLNEGELEYQFIGLQLQSMTRKGSKQHQNYQIDFTQRDLRGNQLNVNYPQANFSKTQKFDAKSRRIELASPHFHEVIPEGGFDPCGNLLTLVQNGNLSEFSYDELYRLTYEEHDEKETQSYGYDSLNNRIKDEKGSYSFDSFNQLKKGPNSSFTYDDDGNLIEKTVEGKTTRFSYDGLNRLSTIIKEDGSKITLIYDFADRLMSIQQSPIDKPAETLDLLYLQDIEIGAYQNGQLKQFRALSGNHLKEVGATQAIELEDQSYYVLNDYRKSIHTLVNIATQQAHHVEYDAYGRSQSDLSSLPWTFQGKRRIDDQLLYFGSRCYDANLGRFINPDPKGIAEGANFYCYANNRPYYYIDPDGYSASPIEPASHTGKQSKVFKVPAGIDISRYEIQHGIRHDKGVDIPDNCNFKENIAIYCNGIDTQPDDFKKNLELIRGKQDLHMPVIGVYNYSLGSARNDLDKYLMEINGYQTRPIRQLIHLLNHFSEHSNPDSYCYLIGFSGGASVARLALLYSPEAVRQKVVFFGLSPGSHVDTGLCASSQHYISTDFVPFLAGNIGNHPNVTYTDHKGNELNSFKSWLIGGGSTRNLISRWIKYGWQHKFASKANQRALDLAIEKINIHCEKGPDHGSLDDLSAIER